jgi:hypothetical protein
MRGQVCSELIQHLDDGTLECGHAPQDVKDWFETIDLPMELLRFMQWRWPQQDCQIAHLSILSSRNIKDDDFSVSLAKARFLLIGSAPNGDWLVIDFSRPGCPPGFVTHEEWDQESDPKPLFEPIARSLESFLYRIAEGRYIPTDYYAAKPFNDFLREENGA